ncbi:MAG: ribonuclease III [Spirochaetia bacterium]|jgi:ribonuclease-3|nr:ribonuclease III [Spirochaetia bacterium]
MSAEDKKELVENAKNAKRSRSRQLDKLQNILGIKFKDKRMLARALVHRSYLNEHIPDLSDNERLEYLGDSVLGLVVNEYLFKHFEEYHEGDLAKIKSVVVSEDILSKVALDMKIGQFLLMGKGEETTGGRERASILANTLEAVIGAYYLDSGLKDSRRFVLGFLKKHIERIDSMTYQRDPKTTLQEYVQKKYKDRPIYEVIDEMGPDHNKEFRVRLVINGKEVITGTGSSKRKAEMDAASSALHKLEKGDIRI